MLLKHRGNSEEIKGTTVKHPASALIKRGRIEYKPLPLFMRESQVKDETEAESISVESEQQPAILMEEEIGQLRATAAEEVNVAKSQAAEIIAQAQVKAKKLIEQAKFYTQTAQTNAEREGFEEGKQRARESALSELSNVMENARATLSDLVALRDTLAKQMEPGLAKLAIKIAEKVIAREVALDPDIVIAMVRTQLDKMKDRDRVVIHVHPDDYENVKSKKEIFTQFAPHVRSIEIESDARVDRGGCMVETDLGTVDASIATQLEAIELAFSKAEGHSDPNHAADEH